MKLELAYQHAAIRPEPDGSWRAWTALVLAVRLRGTAAHTSVGREPVTTPEGEALIDGKGRHSYVTSAGSGPSVGKHLLMSYLPPEHAKVGTRLRVEYFGEQYPVSVAMAGATPLFDPTNDRIRR